MTAQTPNTAPAPPAPSPPRFGVMIANWNGAAVIERCLGSVLAAERHFGHDLERLVHDDASSDASHDLIARAFPAFTLMRAPHNVGYAESVNRALRAMHCDWVFLLNNDLVLKTDFFAQLAAALDSADPAALFAVGAQTRDWDTQTINHGGQRAAWRGGMLLQEPFEADSLAPADFFQAGACLVDRRKFLALGGFAPIFHPGYWEDYELGWRARDRRWQTLYEPRAVAFHWGKGSMRRKLGDWGVNLALRRNHLLFTWSALRTPAQAAAHVLGLPLLILRDPAPADTPGWLRALLAALPRLPALLRWTRRPPVT